MRQTSRAHHRPKWRWLLLLGCAVGVALGVAWWFTPPTEILAYSKGPPPTWSKLRREQALLPEGPPALQPSFVPLTAVAVDLQLAVLAGEDIGFLGHGAWDQEAVREAVEQWLEGGRLRGASTLAQQLAKNLFLSEDRSFIRKLLEARYAFWLEKTLGKQRVLELYLNIVELGDGLFGVEDAARHYFGRAAAALDVDQAAALAATIPSPLKHNPETRTRAWRGRYAIIRERMATYESIRQRLSATMPRAARPAARPEPELREALRRAAAAARLHELAKQAPPDSLEAQDAAAPEATGAPSNPDESGVSR